MAHFTSPPGKAQGPGARHLDARDLLVLDAIDETEALELARGLLAQQSENPPGAEEACAGFLASFLEARGVDCRLVEVAPGRPNLYATLGDQRPRLVLCGHLDTVPAGDGWTRDPFSGTVSGGKLYGRGACDMKAGLAAMAAALLALKRSDVALRGSVALHAVVDEEMSSAGARKAATEEPADWVVVAEPSSVQVLSVGNGQLNFEIVFHGHAVHSSHPEDGRNAIGDAAGLIRLLENENARLADATFPGIGPATFSVGLVAGGRGASTVADRCELTVDRRVLPSESLEDVEAQVRGLLERLETERPGLRWEMSRTAGFRPLRGTGAHGLEVALKGALANLGHVVPSEPLGMRFATDASWYEAAGRDAVVFGPGKVTLAHQPDEYVAIDDLNEVARVLAICGSRLLA